MAATKYRNQYHSLMHDGVETVVGQLTVDLGIAHNNFTVVPSFKGSTISATVATDAVALAWQYGTQPGTFVLTVSEAGVLSNDAYDVSFIAIERGIKA